MNEIQVGSTAEMKPQYRHRVNGGPRTPRSDMGSKKSDLQAHADMLERMVTRFSERIRVLEGLHTMRVEEAGLIISSVFMLYQRWRDEHPDEPDRGESFMVWMERLTAEEVVACAMGKWDSLPGNVE